MSTLQTTLGRVFVSSTCYDLIDARAAVAHALGDGGLEPILSDAPDSKFAVSGSSNAIDTCLVNLRTCEKVIVLLSQRYGASLKKEGFEDISATHMEYREARKHQIPIVFYLRDRLASDYHAHKRNPGGFRPFWAAEQEAERLFKLIAEHEQLENSTKPNWYWPFTTSLDLCRRVLLDLGTTAASARLRLLLAQDKLPSLSIRVGTRAGDERSAQITNLGPVPALDVKLVHPDGSQVFGGRDLQTCNTADFKFRIGAGVFSMRGGHLPVFRADYDIPSGESVREYFAILVDSGPNRIVPVGRELLGRSLRAEVPTLQKVGAYTLIDGARISAEYDAGRIAGPT